MKIEINISGGSTTHLTLEEENKTTWRITATKRELAGKPLEKEFLGYADKNDLKRIAKIS